MTVAINANHLLKNYKEGHGNYIYECFSRITKQYPRHTFIFIFNRKFDPGFIFSENTIPVVVGPEAKNLLLLKFWYNYKIPAVLKKYKADLFINTDVLCSLNTKVPQLLIIHDLTFLHHTKLISKKYLQYRKKHTLKFLNRAERLIVLSDFCKNNIIDDLKIDPGKIDVVYTGVGKFQPTIFMEREKIKEQYSQGNEYFLVWSDSYDQKNLFTILKAFSVFKKWQKSSMHLLIVTISSLRQEDLQRLSLFKYAEDVKILEDSTELPGITASAYAVVDFSYNESFGVHCLEAMKCHVPLITYHDGAIGEICADAALYTTPGEYNDLAEKMMMIFKDEKLRDELIEKGKEKVRKYNWQKTAELFWESILKATG